MAHWRPSLISAVCYRDPKAALKFLEAGFGFELAMLIEDGEGNLVHSEMRFGDAAIMVGNEWSDDRRVHTTGQAHAIASSTGRPKPSYSEG